MVSASGELIFHLCSHQHLYQVDIFCRATKELLVKGQNLRLMVGPIGSNSFTLTPKCSSILQSSAFLTI